MILGIPFSTYVLIHVVLSLTGIFSGFIVMLGMLNAKRLDGWTALFLVTTVLTSMTGFYFPAVTLGPSQIVGIISLIVLALAILAFYAYHLAGHWRWIYVICAVLAFYFNVFVGVVQAFRKVGFLQPLAPTQTEPPFLFTQLVVMVIFIVLGIATVKLFHPKANPSALNSV